MPIDFGPHLQRLGWSQQQLSDEVLARNWFHRIDLGNGLTTPGYDPTLPKLDALQLPNSFAGKSVIDVGAYDGFFSFECESRGAERVVASDQYVWAWPGNDAKRNVELLKQLLDSKVELLEVPVEKLSPETAGVFDIVLFLGVLYHAPDPIGYLKAIRSITGEMLVLETMVDMLDVDRPAAAFYTDLNNDGSNYWGPNRLAVEAMCLKVGFSKVDYKGMWHRDTVAQFAGKAASATPTSGRMVFHVYP